ncbi:putative RNA 2'-phosphotransferase [Actinopolyspora alba]|uniref:Probable RNA 2'-phosphotransferase n=1 Tax=Actinopolyspora alba TaxID=673379 RepID=A0A1I1ZCF2_9ACTN|nr:RNA 2'-phosphotransferase [Actinopolyspora alba]SFE29387.1 putative RNA 2'-phosphotransferase [Actinopolyspora alba]
MEQREIVRVSKRLALYLRHAPDRIGIRLDADGWVSVDELLSALDEHGMPLTRARLAEVVLRNDKSRFSFDRTGESIRANQGHSVAVDLDLPVTSPPEVLYHGTVERFLPSIRADGLLPRNRHHVHLSASVAEARAVGARRGTPVVLEIAAREMVEADHEFRVSTNGVWLVDRVPPGFLRRGT